MQNKKKEFSMAINFSRLIAALQKVVGENPDFEFQVSMFQSAGSFEKALDVFFKNIISSLDTVNKINYNLAIASVISLQSEEDVKTNIKKFVTKTYEETLVYWVELFVEIVKMYPSSLEEKEEILKRKERFKPELKLELTGINETAKTLLNWNKHFNLNRIPEFSEYLQLLDTLSIINADRFFVVLKATLKGDTTVDKHMIEDFLSKA
jgi:hypothetical protein